MITGKDFQDWCFRNGQENEHEAMTAARFARHCVEQKQAEIDALKAENKRLQEKCEHSAIARFNWRNKYLTLIGSIIAILGLDDLTARDDVVLAVEALKAQRDALLTDLSAATEVGDQATPADIVGVVKAMWEELRWLLKQADALKAQNAELLAALGWYGEHSRLARLITSEGDAGRNAIASDGGQKAREAIAKARGES